MATQPAVSVDTGTEISHAAPTQVTTQLLGNGCVGPTLTTIPMGIFSSPLTPPSKELNSDIIYLEILSDPTG